MKISKLYLNKIDMTLIMLLIGGYFVVSVGLSFILSGQYADIVSNTMLLLALVFYITYIYKRHMEYSVYDSNSKHNYKQIEALFNIFSMYKFDYPLPEMRHWAVSPDALLYLLREAIKSKAALIVECGSGVSTIVLAKLMKENGVGHVYSLDHDESYAEKTRDLLKLHGLESFATVITAPLSDMVIENKTYQWYSNEGVNQIPDHIDMIFVDGPPAPEGSFNRFPALSVLRNKMRDHCHIIMDDVIRNDELEISKIWAKSLGRENVVYHDVEKKLAII